MPVEVVGIARENEEREMDDKSEEEDGADDLKCLDWLVDYRLPEYFALDGSFHHFTEKNLLFSPSSASISEDIMCDDTSTEKRLANKCSLLCWIYRVLATSPERQLSLSDIYHRFLVLNPDWVKRSPNWKFSIGETLLSSKSFIYKHSLWSVNADFALKHERAALVQGPSHRCPPSVPSAYKIVNTSKKKCSSDMLKSFEPYEEIKLRNMSGDC
ncbi:Uncharacterized protein BM_BM588 [Brugia malayi]|uniref:Bm588 n=1 Tax=Brugia malayi TaxID=6279 RepID=A0A0K0JKR3_BRUMA|nr:Uncharacterized protein BM_BM588 [Brugia malayi]CRZ25087.1 Bm588 [Brugia malayi]VIO98789.1 Uncharacterized protein BM_BM588 [Brugia malayi]